MLKRISLLVAVAALLLTACSNGDATDTDSTHVDSGDVESSGGTLEAIIDPGGETYGFGDFVSGSDKSFGVFVCARDGAVEINSVEPMHTEGEIEYLGTTVYVSDERFVGAVHGYPPDGIDETRLSELEGTVVDADCTVSEGDKVQLLIGAERTGDGGGVLDGFLVDTSGGELEIPLTVLLCGNEMEYCEALIPADDA